MVEIEERSMEHIVGENSNKYKEVKKKRRVSLEEATKELMEDSGFQPLHINKVDNETLKAFKDLSHNDFRGDYGMCLKFMLEMYYVGGYIRMVEMKLNRIENIIESLLEDGLKEVVGDVKDDKSDTGKSDEDDRTPVSMDGKKIKGW
jgi:hypothetical protein